MIDRSHHTSGYGIVWAQNGRWLAAALPEPSGHGNALFRISVESGAVKQMTSTGPEQEDDRPALSPDGTMLIFARHSPTSWGMLYMLGVDADLNVSGLPLQPVRTAGLRGRRSVWTPDSRSILAATPDGFYRITVSGAELPQRLEWLGRPLTAGAAGNDGLTISQDGNRLAFSQVRGDANIWRLDLITKGAKPERLIASKGRDVYPQYSPDGKRIAFLSNRAGNPQIWLADPDGKGVQQLTSMPGPLTASPHWSPDGKTIEFDSNPDGHYDIYTIAAGGGSPKKLTNGGTSFGGTFSRDGRSIYFCSNRTGQNEVWKMPVAGGTATQVTRNGGLKALESVDGKSLYFAKDANGEALWTKPVAGGPEKQVLQGLYRLNFLVTKQGVYYMTEPAEDGTSTLRFYNFATDQSNLIFPVGSPEFGLDVSPDGRFLIYAQIDELAGHLMLVDGFR
jgi:Tol biopolymer transport system component